jgi:uncharacterized protein (DUF1501 family)
MYLTRRGFVKAAFGGMTALVVPSWGRVARAQAGSQKTLVVIFLRGGADGLNLVAPIDPAGVSQAQRDAYSVTLRPGIGLSVSGSYPSLALDGYFRLHASMSRLTAANGLWTQGRLAVVHAVGGTNSYSHFEAQDAMERAVNASPQLYADGWLFRSAEHLIQATPTALTGVSLAAATAKALEGTSGDLSLAMSSVAGFTLTNYPNVGFGTQRRAVLASLFERAEHPLLRAAGGSAYSALSVIQQAGVANIPPAVVYQNSPIRARLEDAARLVKSNIGVRLITIDHGGWDHHQGLPGAINARATELSNGLSDFYLDLDAAGRGGDVLTLCMTEFGRTAAENSTGDPAPNRGTDHGYGTVMLVAGGNVDGGRVLTRAYQGNTSTGQATPSGHWPGLLPAELHQSGAQAARDLQVSTDYRDVFAEVLQAFLGLSAGTTQSVLRGYAATPVGLF